MGELRTAKSFQWRTDDVTSSLPAYDLDDVRAEVDVTDFRSRDECSRRPAVDSARESPRDTHPTLVFRDVCVTIDKKHILDSINGLARRGEMLAIMGPSGAGKSTLLNVLAGRIAATSGCIRLCGQPVDRHVRRKISYVIQQDVFYPLLTLQETLMFAASVRLPDSMSIEHKQRRLSEIVDALELTKCLHTRMGDALVTGLSGGEKKRASIACELITNPHIIILDEPTSGLDSAIAYHLMWLLDRFSRTAQKTVITTVHQPSSQMFHMFSSVLLIDDGQVSYFGRRADIVPFFADLGLHCAPRYNPADFIIETVKSDVETRQRIIASAKRRMPTAVSDSEAWRLADDDVINRDVNGNDDVTNHAYYITEGRRDEVPSFSSESFKYVQPCATAPPAAVPASAATQLDAKWPTGFRSQYFALTRRAFKLSRNRLLSRLNFVMILFVALFSGSIYFQLERSVDSGKNRMGAIYTCVVYYSFVSMIDAITLMTDATGVFRRERSAGIYRLSAYYLSSMTVEAPMACLLPTMYVIIIYWMAGLMPTAGNFVAFWLLMLLNVFTSQGIGVFFGVLIRNSQLAKTISQSFRIASFLAAGYYNTHMHIWMKWTKYLSYMFYIYGALCKVEFVYGDPLACPANATAAYRDFCFDPVLFNDTHNSTETPFPPAGDGGSVPGAVFLAEMQLSDTPLYVDVVVMFVVCIVARVSAYFILLRWRRPVST